VLERVAHLVGAVIGIERHHAGAGGVQCQEVEEMVGPVLEQQRHAVAGPVAGRAIARGQRRDRLRYLAIGDRRARQAPLLREPARHGEEIVVRQLARRVEQQRRDRVDTGRQRVHDAKILMPSGFGRPLLVLALSDGQAEMPASTSISARRSM